MLIRRSYDIVAIVTRPCREFSEAVCQLAVQVSLAYQIRTFDTNFFLSDISNEKKHGQIAFIL